MKTAIIYIGEGIGNILMTTPMIKAVHSLGYKIWLKIRPSSKAGYEVLKDWDIIEKSELPKPDIAIYTYWYKYFPSKVAFDCLAMFPERPDWDVQNEIEFNMKFARDLGYTGDTPPVYNFTPLSIYPTHSETIAIAPGVFPNKAGSKKLWPYWNKLISKIQDKIILLGSKNDFYPPISLTQNIVDLRGKTTIKEAAEYIRSAKLFIGHDGGLAHISAAVNQKTFIIFGYTGVKKSCPPNATVIQKVLDCQPCQFNPVVYTHCKDNRCLTSLSAEEVYLKIFNRR